MRTVRIWTLESDYDATAVKCLAHKLTTHLQLSNLSIRTSGKSAIPRRTRTGAPLSDHLRLATQNYLREEACVIFVIDQDSPMSLHQRRQEPNSLINQIRAVIKEQSLAGKVFLALAVQELEAWLLVDCLGIFCYFARQNPQHRKIDRDSVSTTQSFTQLVERYQKGNTEIIVEAEIGGRGAKEYLMRFSKQILRELNPSMPQKNVNEKRYREKMSPGMAKHVDIDRQTLQRNNSLRKLGEVLAQFN